VAEDGDVKSGNGLYTQFLLQELKKPVAKIEDVFKRVRFNVRKQSDGRQIPWESTSLEDDFFFNNGQVVPPPKSDAQQREQAFNEQRAQWDRIKTSRNADDFYAFLQQYPSGPLSEAVQERLEQLAKARITAAPARGREAEADAVSSSRPRFRIGDSRSYEYRDGLTGLVVRRETQTITALRDDVVEINNWAIVQTLNGSFIRNDQGISFDPPLLTVPIDDLTIGKKWVARSQQSRAMPPVQGWVENDSRVTAYEEVTVPAGTFKAYRIESQIRAQSGLVGQHTTWFVKGYGPVRVVRKARTRTGQDDSYTRDLVTQTRAPA
jgi:hypothetical protein